MRIVILMVVGLAVFSVVWGLSINRCQDIDAHRRKDFESRCILVGHSTMDCDMMAMKLYPAPVCH